MVRDEEKGSFGIEAIFLGGMALIVFGIALFAAMNTSFGGTGANGSNNSGSTTISSSPGTVTSVVNSSGQNDVICACYNEGFELAGKISDVQSTTYRTGFSQCRALGSVEGGNAWSAGWDARRSGRAYEATCKAYKRRS